MNNIQISTNKNLLEINFIQQFISHSYLGKGRTIETIKTCIENSLNFGIYLNQKQIAYARVVTDYAVFAYILDLFVEEQHRGNGYSKFLMQSILADDALKKISVWRLATTDAHGLYEKFGFKKNENPENMMELKL